jgi:Na+/H+-translocating membrane pyrophosphatase
MLVSNTLQSDLLVDGVWQPAASGRRLPVHEAMREISELIYETCKTYLQTQGRFLVILEIFIGAAIVFYFGFLLGEFNLRNSLLGVGLARGIGALNLRVIGSIFMSWVITLPAGAGLSILFFFFLKGVFS